MTVAGRPGAVRPERGDLWSLADLRIRTGDEVNVVLVCQVHDAYVAVAAVHPFAEYEAAGDYRAGRRTVPWPVVVECDLLFALERRRLGRRMGSVDMDDLTASSAPPVQPGERRWVWKESRGEMVREIQLTPP